MNPKNNKPPRRKFTRKVSNLRTAILPLLLENVFHVTSYSSYEGILKSGYIFPNGEKRFNLGFSNHENNYGNFKNFICLFDFRNKTKSEIEDGILKCNFLEGSYLSDHLVFMTMKKELHNSLIYGDEAFEEVRFEKRFVPYVECWSPKPISINDIESVIDLSIRRPRIEEGTLEWAITEANRPKSVKKPNYKKAPGKIKKLERLILKTIKNRPNG